MFIVCVCATFLGHALLLCRELWPQSQLITGFGAAGATHDNPRTPNVHISGPRRFKHHQNSTKGPQERERRKKIVAGGGKKERNFGPPTLRGHPSGPHPSGPPPFWAPPPFEAPPFWAPLLGSPPFLGLGLHPSGPHPSRPHTMSSQNLTSKNWPKSNWPKSKLAEVEIGRSRSRSASVVGKLGWHSAHAPCKENKPSWWHPSFSVFVFSFSSSYLFFLFNFVSQNTFAPNPKPQT